MSSKLAKLSKIECGKASSCFVHDKFYLPKISRKECITCKKESEKVFKQDHNLFAETVSVPELVIQLDEIAKQVQSNHKPSNSRNKKKNKKQEASKTENFLRMQGLMLDAFKP